MDSQKVREAIHQHYYVGTKIVTEGGVQRVEVTGTLFPDHIRGLLEIAKDNGGNLQYTTDREGRQFLAVFPADVS